MKTYTFGIPNKFSLLSNNSRIGKLKAINNPKVIRISFCSWRFFIFKVRLVLSKNNQLYALQTLIFVYSDLNSVFKKSYNSILN